MLGTAGRDRDLGSPVLLRRPRVHGEDVRRAGPGPDLLLPAVQHRAAVLAVICRAGTGRPGRREGRRRVRHPRLQARTDQGGHGRERAGDRDGQDPGRRRRRDPPRPGLCHHPHRPGNREGRDLLPGRDGEPFEKWLRAHPGTEVICRDRGTAYAGAARAAAPGATQVADRFHLEKNLSEAVDKTVRALLPGLEPGKLRAGPQDYRTSHGKESTLVERCLRLHPRVKELRAAGLSIAGTARELGISEPAAAKYDKAATPEELLVTATRRRSALDPWKPYLSRRWNEGETEVLTLDKEIREQGWTGSINLVYRYLRPLRTADGRNPAGRAARKHAPGTGLPKPGDVARWIMSHPCNLGTADAGSLRAVLEASPELRTARALVLAFHDMTGGLRGQYLDDWIAAAREATLPALHSFADGLERDIDAVRNGLTLPWSSGPVEGKNCKFKHIKRLMYGRASFAFLRKMILGR